MHHRTFSLIGGAGLGAGLMYFLEPDRGRRRRTLVRDKGTRWSRKTREFAGSASRDVRNRAKGMGRIPGVKQIFNRLERHQSPEDVPALQGPQGPMDRKPGPRFALLQSHWSPTTRMAAALMGTAAVLYGLNQRTVGATTVAASGLGLLVRSATNQEFSRLFDFREHFEHLEKAA